MLGAKPNPAEVNGFSLKGIGAVAITENITPAVTFLMYKPLWLTESCAKMFWVAKIITIKRNAFLIFKFLNSCCFVLLDSSGKAIHLATADEVLSSSENIVVEVLLPLGSPLSLYESFSYGLWGQITLFLLAMQSQDGDIKKLLIQITNLT